MNYPNLVTTKELKGLQVNDLNHKQLGVISELVINKISGDVVLVVVNFGGFYGHGNQYFSFPWEAFQYSLGKNCFVLDIDVDLLKATVGFDKEQWPNFNTISFLKYYQ